MRDFGAAPKPNRIHCGSTITVAMSTLFLAALALLTLQSRISSERYHSRNGNPSLPSLADLIDHQMSRALRDAANAHPYLACAATNLRFRNHPEFRPAVDVLSSLDGSMQPSHNGGREKAKRYNTNDMKDREKGGNAEIRERDAEAEEVEMVAAVAGDNGAIPAAGEILTGRVKGNSFVELLAQEAPCWGMSNCCQINMYLRPGRTEDIEALRRAYQLHELRLLYSLYKDRSPKYVLDAGSGIGMETQIMKLVFPYSVHVALEPDAQRFESLLLNTREIDGVHAVHGALWPRQALLSWKDLRGKRTEREKSRYLTDAFSMFRTTDVKRILKLGGFLGFTVADLKDMFDIPSFEVVFLDIEGAYSP